MSLLTSVPLVFEIERRQLSWQKGDQVGAVGEVAVVKDKARILLLGILIKMVNSRGFVREAGRRP
jgi:hypothetical protein